MKLQFLVILNCYLLAAYAGSIKQSTQPDDSISSTDTNGLSGRSESTTESEANIVKPDSKATVSDSTKESESAFHADTMEPDTKELGATVPDSTVESESAIHADIIETDNKILDATVPDSTVESESAVHADIIETDNKVLDATVSDTIAPVEPVDEKFAADAQDPIIIVESPPSDSAQGVRSPYYQQPPWYNGAAQQANVNNTNSNNLSFNITYSG